MVEKKDVAFYAPEDDDGSAAYEAIVDAVDGDEAYHLLLQDVCAPLVKTILDYRCWEAEISDEEFFVTVGYVLADAICIMTEVAVSDGKQQFVRNMLTIIGSVLAHKVGKDSIPEREECLKVIRKLYN